MPRARVGGLAHTEKISIKHGKNRKKKADGEGFESPIPASVQQFSRLPDNSRNSYSQKNLDTQSTALWGDNWGACDAATCAQVLESSIDKRLQAVIAAWPKLPESLKQAIALLVSNR